MMLVWLSAELFGPILTAVVAAVAMVKAIPPDSLVSDMSKDSEPVPVSVVVTWLRILPSETFPTSVGGASELCFDM